MIIALMAGWLLVGLVLALGVGAAVRVAEACGEWQPVTEPLPEVLASV